jgi:xanthine/CO dehydrogenase XdhC/CoxF family maturation factor
MSATRSIAQALANTTEPVVLATVVRITGSSYGGVGTRMIIRQNAPPIGIVSGGCLEADLAEHAKQVHLSHIPKVVTYDTRADDDAAWGLGLGCNGLIDVLLEPLTPTDAHQLADLLMRALDSDSASVVATIIESDNPASVGAHALFFDGTSHLTGWNSEDLIEQIRTDSEEAFSESRRGMIRSYGAITVAFEVVTPSIHLVICGSGPDVVPLVRFASELGWNLTVIDHRPIIDEHKERFPGAHPVECSEPKDLAKAANISNHTAAVVMSHNYARDLDYVRALLASDAAYIGILGPRARTERMLADMASAGETVTRGERIHSPVGVDIGGDGPDSIALSIIAEVSTVIYRRSGGHLRDSRGPLHASPASEVATRN